MEHHNSRSSMASNASDMRRSSVFLRASVALRSTIDTVGEKIEQGTLAGAILNTLCNVMGAGVLSMSFAMYNASLGFGVILLVYSAICSAVASFILAKGCDDVGVFTMKEMLALAIYPTTSRSDFRKNLAAKRDLTADRDSPGPDGMSRTYTTDMEQYAEAEAQLARKRDRVILTMNIIIFLYNYGTLIVYGRVIADSIPPVIEDFLHGSGFWIKDYTWLGLAGVIFFVLSCARNMEELKWTSLLGFITIFYVVVIVVVRVITNVSHKVVPQTAETKDVSYFHFTMDTFKSITTYGLAFCYHYNVPYYYKELRNHTPKKFMVTVAVCLPVTTISYALVGICGYLTFGAAVGDAAAGGNIVNNYPKDDLLVNIGRLGLFFHFVSVYPILSVSARRGLHGLLCRFIFNKRAAEKNALLSPSQKQESYTADDLDEAGTMANPNDLENNPTTPQIICEAFFLVSTTAVIAYFVPGVGIVIEISGCLFGVFLMFFVPGIVGLNIFNGKYKSKSTSLLGNDDGTSTNYFGSHTGKKSRYWYVALFQLITGIVFMITASTSLIYGFATGNGTG